MSPAAPGHESVRELESVVVSGSLALSQAFICALGLRRASAMLLRGGALELPDHCETALPPPAPRNRGRGR